MSSTEEEGNQLSRTNHAGENAQKEKHKGNVQQNTAEIVNKKAATTNTIPIIDMRKSEQECAVDMYNACTQYGFFYLVNHGMSQELIDSVAQHSRTFFSLPLEEKERVMANMHDKNNRGYTPFREEILDPKRQTIGDTKEGYYIGPEQPPGKHFPLHGPNVWPDLPGWRETMETYMSQMTSLSHRLLRVLSLSLSLPPTHFHPHFTHPMAFIRLLHYSPEPSSPADGIFGAGEHTDYGMLTLLWTDGTPGLQIRPREQGGMGEGKERKLTHTQEWMDVPHIPGAFVVNLGDMLQRWTNDLYSSTPHRVVSVGDTDRYSIPFFFEPNFDTLVECLPTCCSKDNPPRYPPTHSGQHLLDLYEKTHTNFAHTEN
eukprot:GDKI01031221.1.p1 GENE.GDKI01031221.1~~GDKI01031221.1.p1  ORF type:complete len:371 (-),score=71.63 GDKI01031221.1:163-1275(-)